MVLFDVVPGFFLRRVGSRGWFGFWRRLNQIFGFLRCLLFRCVQIFRRQSLVALRILRRQVGDHVEIGIVSLRCPLRRFLFRRLRYFAGHPFCGGGRVVDRNGDLVTHDVACAARQLRIGFGKSVRLFGKHGDVLADIDVDLLVHALIDRQFKRLRSRELGVEIPVAQAVVIALVIAVPILLIEGSELRLVCPIVMIIRIIDGGDGSVAAQRTADEGQG